LYLLLLWLCDFGFITAVLTRVQNVIDVGLKGVFLFQSDLATTYLQFCLNDSFLPFSDLDILLSLEEDLVSHLLLDAQLGHALEAR